LWLGALPSPPGVNWGAFRRGFVESLWMNCEEPEAAALAAAFAAVPVRCLVMTGLSGPKLEEILSGAHLARLHTLVVRCCGSGNTAAELLARSPHLSHLRRLTLEAVRLEDAALATLVNSDSLPCLEALSVTNNPIR